MKLDKKGVQFGTFEIVAGLVLIFLVVLLLLGLLGKGFFNFLKIGNCVDREGHAVSGGGCKDGEEIQLYGVLMGLNPGEICCKPIEVTPGTPGSGITSKEQALIENAFTLKVDNSKAISDRSTITLKVGKTYNLPMTFNSKLTDEKLGLKDKIGYCAIYVTDSRDNNKKYVFSSSGGLEAAPAASEMLTKELFDCKNGGMPKVTYTPTQEDVYKDLTLYIILLDNETKDAYDKGKSDSYALFNSLYISQNWLTSDIFRIKVEPLVKISGLSGEWVAKDDITVSCEDLTCTKFEFKLVNVGEGTFSEMLEKCKSTDTNFATTMHYVSGTTTQMTGVPLNIDLGDFRLPSQQKIQYVVSPQDLTVINNKVNVIIDRGTMLKSFYEKNKDPNTIIGQKTHLCVRATLADKTTMTTLSSEPLKVDIMPPIVNAEQIKVIYPDPIQSIDKATLYYYRQYPRVVITNCYDYGQSGCANYDYYIHTGNFVNLRANTADWQTGVVGLFLTEGLNSLLSYFTSQDAGNTLCPYILGPGYIRNSNTEIRFMDQGQGIICLKVGDKAGNFDLVWKALWTPEEMFSRIVANETNEFLSNTAK
jgi:hypothetical protein